MHQASANQWKMKMKETPIIFNGEMVRALLNGHKSQTRRIIKPQPATWNAGSIFKKAYPGLNFQLETGEWVICPYGVVGDQLWVRETWRVVGWHEGEPMNIEFKDKSRMCENSTGDEFNYEDWCEKIWIQCAEDSEKAGIELVDDFYDWGDKEIATRWRPSIHMPRWASRIQLEITDIRVERLNKITAQDAMSEGVCIFENFSAANARKPVVEFKTLWQSIHGPCSWEVNPYVWRIEFEVMKNV